MEYKFVTQSDGTTTPKIHVGCFEDKYIDNDLAFVFEQIDKYNYRLYMETVIHQHSL